jgi:hypothetical protein
MLDRIGKPRQFVVRWLLTRGGQVAAVKNDWNWSDYCGAVGVRIGIDRYRYLIDPGLYAVAVPGPDDPVLVTANYKLTFDMLRRDVRGLNAWILVLDTKGINVWCAAGKGTFSTDELVRRIKMVGLEKVINHRTLIVPQLGATGVAAHEVKKACGFQVVFGPVRSKDIKAFLQAGMQATPRMRQVSFSLGERLAVALVECSRSIKPLGLALVALFILAGFGMDVFSWDRARQGVWLGFLILFAGFVAGGILTPMLLPWLPGRAFSQKGAEAGAIVGLILLMFVKTGVLLGLGLLLGIIAVGSWYGMQFTGASTYTSPTGVEKEMRRAIPWQAAAAIGAVILWRAGIC